MENTWTPIHGYEGVYWLSRDGRIINARGVLLKPFETQAGLQVELRNNGQRERMLVDQLVLKTFGGK